MVAESVVNQHRNGQLTRTLSAQPSQEFEGSYKNPLLSGLAILIASVPVALPLVLQGNCTYLCCAAAVGR